MRLIATKHSHPDKTVIAVSAMMLKQLKKQRVEPFSDLLLMVKETQESDILFLPALNFLYLMGVIEYRKKTDTIEYIGGVK